MQYDFIKQIAGGSAVHGRNISRLAKTQGQNIRRDLSKGAFVFDFIDHQNSFDVRSTEPTGERFIFRG
jgi:hypothetical protein